MFANGDTYSGEFYKGAIEGEGAYYNSETQKTVLTIHHYRTNKIEKKVLEQGNNRVLHPIPFSALPWEEWIDVEELVNEELGLQKVRSVLSLWATIKQSQVSDKFKTNIVISSQLDQQQAIEKGYESDSEDGSYN